MEKIFTDLQQLVEEVKDYVNVKVSLVKLNIAETTSRIIANASAIIISAFIFLFVLFFASTALALFLSAMIGKAYSGFLIVAGIYLLTGLVIWYSRKRLLQIPIMNAIIKQMFSEEPGPSENGK